MSRDIILFGDSQGIRQLLTVIPAKRICLIVAAQRRPQYIDDLRVLAGTIGADFQVQPYASSADELAIFEHRLITLDVSYILSNSYSMKISAPLTDYYSGRIVNIHYSLLPQNRGPNPENWALIHGDSVTGVSLHHVDSSIDTGSVICQHKVSISNADTWVSLLSRLDLACTDYILPYIRKVIADHSQFPHGHTQCVDSTISNHRLDPEYPKIDPESMSDIEIYNLIRAQVHPLRGAYFQTQHGRVYIDYYIALEDIPSLRNAMSSAL